MNIKGKNGLKAEPLLVRLNSRLEKTGACWEWTGCKTADGYGIIRVDGKNKLVHRAMWEESVGKIPAGQCVCHRCDNPKCARPGHLFLGTHQENMADAKKKGRTKPVDSAGVKNVKAKLTDESVHAIRSLAGTLSQRAIGLKFGVTDVSVSYILSGKTWRHI